MTFLEKRMPVFRDPMYYIYDVHMCNYLHGVRYVYDAHMCNHLHGGRYIYFAGIYNSKKFGEDERLYMQKKKELKGREVHY